MAVYPETSAPYADPVHIDIKYKTLRSNFDDLGEEKRRQKWLYPKRDITLKYNALTKDQAEVLWEFYCAQKGSYGSFVWFESTGQGTPRSYSSEYVATGDSTTLAFDLPAIDSSAYSNQICLGGTSIASTNITMSYGGGSNGEDHVTFVSSGSGGLGPPSTTERITYNFTGRLKVRCTFAEDILSFENFYDRLINSGVKLNGLLNS